MLIHIKMVHHDFYKRRIGELCEKFPHLFNKQFPMPLSIGIHKQLLEATDFSAKEISVLLRVWTHRVEYLAMGQSVGSRMDLQGNVTLMAPEHVQGFIAVHQRMSDNFIKRFAKHFNKQFGYPAFIAVPIKYRKEFELGSEKGSSRKCCGDCTGKGSCKGHTQTQTKG